MTETRTNSQVRVLLTGGIGSGKSTVAARLRELGADVIEADRIGHLVLEPGGAAFQDVAASWPGAVREGRIDRALLARIVFSEPSELQRLEQITHPAIGEEIRRRVERSGAAVVVVEVPVAVPLLEGDWVRLVVTAPLETRIARGVARGAEEDDVRRRAAVQPDDIEWADGADHVIANDGTLPELIAAIDAFWAELVG